MVEVWMPWVYWVYTPGDAQMFQLGVESRLQSMLLSLGSPALHFLGHSQHLLGSVFRSVSSFSPPCRASGSLSCFAL